MHNYEIFTFIFFYGDHFKMTIICCNYVRVKTIQIIKLNQQIDYMNTVMSKERLLKYALK